MPSRQFHESRTTKQIISETGIVGARGTLLIKPDFYNHMPASEVRTKLGREIFDSYYKFCVTRNPFDKIVSHFWWDSRKVPDFSNDPFSKIRHRFAEYVSQGFGGFNDHFIFMVDGYPVIDEFIRYEYLSSDIEQVCRALDIDISVELGSYRTEFRKRPEHFSEYYDSATKEFVEREFTWEMDRFNYTLSG